MFNWIDPLVSVLALLVYGALLGAIVGALANLVLHATSGGGRRDFSSTARMEAAAYDVLVDDEWADDAARVLRSSE